MGIIIGLTTLLAGLPIMIILPVVIIIGLLLLLFGAWIAKKIITMLIGMFKKKENYTRNTMFRNYGCCT